MAILFAGCFEHLPFETLPVERIDRYAPVIGLPRRPWHIECARIVNANLADYRVPVHADVPPIDVIFVEERDRHVNPLGAKGIAELTLVGVAPAVANAVYHATGKRIRDLPITPDKLL